MHKWGLWLVTLAVGLGLLAACKPEPLGYTFEELPPGDIEHGTALFADHCQSCHALDGGQSSGPGVADYGNSAGGRVSGQSPEEYTFNSILRPAKHVVQGYSNVMPSDYDEKLSQQDIADLIAYLLSLQGEN